MDLVRRAKLNLPTIECRILLTTTPLVAVPVGVDTIYLSRSVLDLPPTTSAIGMLIAGALAHLARGDFD
jgi:hypothetical protein